MILRVLLLSALLVSQGSGDLPSAPAQPAAGPGGAAYRHGSVTKTSLGERGTSYWLFEPADPRPASAPVVIFLHAFSATNPRTYGAWIDHLVRSGKTVIYPRFQYGVLPRIKSFMPNCREALRDAFEVLGTAGHVAPELDHVALVGHSLGGRMAANLAATAERDALPQASALFVVLPGSADFIRDEVALEPLASIPAETLLLTLAASDDSISGETDARRIYLGSTAVGIENKDFLLMHSDAHGTPELSANHLAPMAIDERYTEDVAYGEVEAQRHADALDYFGTWKLFDALCDASFLGTNREYALGNTPEQRHMGTWSDGHPVRALEVKDFSAAPGQAKDD